MENTSLPILYTNPSGGVVLLFYNVTPSVKIPDADDISLVWATEHFPVPIVDELYSVFRYFAWGRITDIESITVAYEPGTRIPEYLYSSSSWSGNDTWGKWRPQHQGGYRRGFVMEDGHPVLYVNNWCHTMDITDNNQWLNKGYRIDPANIEVKTLTSEELENLLVNKKAILSCLSTCR
jgi:hypothetical protein